MEKQRLQYLLNQYAAGSVTNNERQELLEYLTDQEDTSLNHIADFIVSEAPGHARDEAMFRELIEEITLVDKPGGQKAIKPVHRIPFLRTAWFRYAAAVLIIAISAAIVVLLINNRKKNDVVASVEITKDVAPGGNKAVLTLADGSTILLDNASNGNLAQQGSTRIIKLTNGQLAYQQGMSSSNRALLDAGELLYNTIRTPRGGQYQIVLPDGTKVWLNAASSIRFPAAFTGNERKVEIKGEVYLEVTKNPKQPFFVHTNKTRVEVLGTSFNINAYENEEAERTTLIEGSVRIISNEEKVLLTPGRQANIAGNGKSIKVDEKADIEQVIAWKNGLFNFNGLDVRAVMAQLARWYDITVRYEGAVPTNIFMGEMYRDVKLSVVLDRLRELGIKCKMDGKTVIVFEE